MRREKKISTLTQVCEVNFTMLRAFALKHRAGDEARTRDLQLGRLSLYQLSYSRIHIITFSVYISGESRIRTYVAEAADLQSAPFDRSGISPEKSRLLDSNQRPADYKSAALPTELRRQYVKNQRVISKNFILFSTLLILRTAKVSILFNRTNPLH